MIYNQGYETNYLGIYFVHVHTYLFTYIALVGAGTIPYIKWAINYLGHATYLLRIDGQHPYGKHRD